MKRKGHADLSPQATVMTSARSGWFPPLALCGFVLFFELIGRADWGRGHWRGLLLALVPLVLALPKVSSSPARQLERVLAALLVVVVVVRVTVAATYLWYGGGPTVDIGTSTILAVEKIVAGQSPYAAAVDPVGGMVAPGGSGFRFFAGYKYGPMTLLLYGGPVLAAGRVGYVLVNFVVQVLVALAVWRLARPSGLGSAMGATALVLAPGFVNRELLLVGANDYLPLALGLWAIAGRHRFPFWAGCLAGASVAVKLLPGAIFVTVLAAAGEGRRRLLAGALAAMATLFAPPFIQSPREVVANLFVFLIARPPDSSSLAFFLPRGLHHVLIAAAAFFSLYAIRRLSRSEGTDTDIVEAFIMIALAALLSSGAVHRNYLLWLVPTLALTIACRFWGGWNRPEQASTSLAVSGLD